MARKLSQKNESNKPVILNTLLDMVDSITMVEIQSRYYLQGTVTKLDACLRQYTRTYTPQEGKGINNKVRYLCHIRLTTSEYRKKAVERTTWNCSPYITYGLLYPLACTRFFLISIGYKQWL